ncbi:PTS acetylglucosamine transporter subunit IIB [Paenibacillus radicis (ex Gao et al. 2016)]|uniref:PTS acetylglucosamine transporter subunit IIB n=2 Tax=Paenibacillus radicis (ex Gao et al. 2016) TaxID=1737354 RepID=A0A917GNA1_9BACL|nr:PTS acetylglucosamine transporter subunit IIB [Paenibacillus radicis (ex Gao et al. 2016)]
MMLAFLQKIGKSLMLPVAALPAAALLQRFGKIDYVKDFGMGSTGSWLNQYVAPFLEAGGSAIFDHLPLIFAVGIAIGLAGDAVAALAAVIAYQVMVTVQAKVPLVFSGIVGADTELNMGVMGGIIAGFIASYLYNRFHRIRLPDWLGFFSGKRFVPIITSLVMVVVAIALGLVWGPVQNGFDTMGNHVVALNGIGAFIFGVANRLLIPFGLHHVLNSIAWFQIGSFTDETGRIVNGDLWRFFAGDKTAGMFMTGFFPIMMFALPAGALAIIHTAKPAKRKMIASVFIGTAFASFLTGITEPLEFAFMFTAPVLYGLHALMMGLSGYIMMELGVKHGFGFSAGFIDYVINFQLATKPLLIIPVGLAFAVVYYFLFRFAILKFNLKTPGREDDDIADVTPADGTLPEADSELDRIMAALGGASNITGIDACITRLRLVVTNEKAVDDKQLRALGAAGIIRLGGGAVQIVFGTRSETIKDDIMKLL